LLVLPATWVAQNLERDERQLIGQEEMTMARSRTPRETVTSAADAPKPARAASDAATASDIARRAFDLYRAGGCRDGHDVDDWLTAERELLGARRPARTS
jgi:hypothetical protein